MKLKPQNSPKELLEKQNEELRKERSALSEEVTRLLGSRNALQRELQAEGDKAFVSLRQIEQECSAKKDTLLSEILSLEERRKIALMPLTARKARLDAQELAIKSREESVSLKESENLAYQSLLAEKTARLSDRSCELDDREKEISRKEGQIKASLAFHVKSSQSLADKWQEFREYEANILARLAERETELDFKAQEVEKTRNFNEETKKELLAMRTDVDSRRLLLAQGLTELEKRYGKQHLE